MNARSPLRWVLPVLFAGAGVVGLSREAGADEQATVIFAPVAVFTQAPVLVPLDSQVSVVKDYDHAVYYTENQYWQVRDEGWYHSPRWDQPWAVAAIEVVPETIVSRDHRLYIHYRPIAQVKVWSEPNVFYRGPPLFYDPPPLVVVEKDVYVVENFDAPVYYTAGIYWQRRNNHWYRAARWNEPWVSVEINIVPGGISHRDHDHYVHYVDRRDDYIYRESRRAEARQDARDRLARESRAELTRERQRVVAERERQIERQRVAERSDDRREDAAARTRRRLEERRAEDLRDRARVATQRRADEQRDRERAATDRKDRERVAAERQREQKNRERLDRDKNRKPTPAAGPPPERRRVEPRNAPERKQPPPAKRVEEPSRKAPPVKRAEPPRRETPPVKRAEPPRRETPPVKRAEPPRREAPPAAKRVEPKRPDTRAPGRVDNKKKPVLPPGKKVPARGHERDERR